MIDHIGIAVTDVARSRAFYEQALAPLGYKVLKTETSDRGNSVVLFGVEEIDFTIADGERVAEEAHIAFRAKDRATVRAFHAAALAAGGRDNGGPGLRRNITRTIMAPSPSIPTATISRRSATILNDLVPFIPAKAGIQWVEHETLHRRVPFSADWIPAFAGMTG